MITLAQLQARVSEIEERLGVFFENKKFLELAFVHRSYVNEHKEVPEHNERLEFLGDSVLGLAVADYLYRTLPGRPEGELSQLRSRLVDAQSCAKYFLKLRLEEFILLGKGEASSEGRSKSSIQADVFEAVVGAIYLDGGLGVAKSFLLHHFEAEMNETMGAPSRNYKAELQDYAQKKWQKTPLYRVLKEEGPDHAKVFHVAVVVGEEEMGKGVGMSKKEAEQQAACAALEKRVR